MKMKGRREERGNMLILTCFVVAVVTLGLVVAATYGSLVFMENRLRTTADEISLAGARKLNDMDRIGQMNNMIARSRQLVFTSRVQDDEANTHFPQIEIMAQRLHNEARDTAMELESQRQHLRNLAINEANTAMQEKFDSLKGTYPMSLPWLVVKLPNLVDRKMGHIKDIESNVTELKNVEDLESFDESTYISNHPGMKLYKEGIDAKLPSADGDLNFKISSLPAPVNKSINPARLVLFGSFIESSSDALPSACQTKVSVELGTGLGTSATSTMTAIGTSAATGACPAQ